MRATTFDSSAPRNNGATGPSGMRTTAGALIAPALLLLWIAVITTCVAGVFLALEMEDPEAAFHLGAVGATMTLAGVFAHEYRKSRNALSPLCVMVLLMFLLYPFHGWMAEGGEFLQAAIGSDAHVWQARALVVVTLAAPFLWWGFNSRLGARIARRLPGPRFFIADTERATRSKLVALYFLAMLPRVGMLAAGQFFHWGGEREAVEVQFLLNVLSTLPAFVMTWFVVIGLRERHRRWLAIGLAMLAGEIVWGLASGSRLRMFEPVVAVLVAYSYLVKPVGLRRLVAVFLVFALIALPFLTAFRGAYYERVEQQREGVDASTVVDAFSAAATEPDDEEEVVAGSGALRALANRMHGLTSLALVMRFTPERGDYLYGVPYLMIVPQVLIPRFIWPDKPDVGQFRETFRTLYWGLEPNTSTSVAVSQLGDLWANLHLAGPLLGSFFYGLFIAFLFRHLRYGVRNASVFPLVVFAVHLTPFMHALEDTLDSSIAGFIKSLFVYFLVAWLLNRRGVAAPAT